MKILLWLLDRSSSTITALRWTIGVTFNSVTGLKAHTISRRLYGLGKKLLGYCQSLSLFDEKKERKLNRFWSIKKEKNSSSEISILVTQVTAS